MASVRSASWSDVSSPRATGFASSAPSMSIPPKSGATSARSRSLERPLRVKVDPDPRHAIKKSKPDIVVLCTSSSMRGVMPQIEGVLKLKVPIVTTTEELSYPVRRNAPLARKIDAMAKRAKVAVLSTGVNPGLRDGCAADHADGCVRAHRVGDGQPHSGCEHPAAAVSAEDRRGVVARAVPARGRARIDPPCRARRIDLDDCRRAGMADRSHHR